ncbi:APC family permease [Aurantiacibacter rhizosphaerae]|uniref:Amino acid permease n=1 Tax=Aurantiacibacter rhizosphaerae TaxID=2691582 RepID=A0A844XCJ2_9SPHN|nr:APC family permease [Aurantiacibacter rhizosphaerae]MWV27550.1 amino acid permease [Aurantiacibacter rhizosphaerae]
MTGTPIDTATSPTEQGAAKLNRVMGTFSLTVFGLAYLVPLTVFTTFGAVTEITQGHLPLAYVVTTIAMFFTALSYAVLVRKIPSAGSAFAYVSAAFGKRAGFATGWTLLLDYLLLPAINYLIIGIYLNAYFPGIPSSLFIIAAILLVTGLNVVGVDVVKRASLLLVVAQIVFAAVFVAIVFLRPETEFVSYPFYSPGLEWAGLLAGAAILCLSFLGFDAVSTLSEEARDPEKSVPRAILLTALLGGAIFIVLSYAGTLVLGDWRQIQSADTAGLEVMKPLGPIVSAAFIAAYLAGCVASAIASQASVSRILFAMGREGQLPKSWFGHLDRRFNTPTYAICTVGLFSLIAVFISLESLASLISFGALFAFSIVNLSVPFIFREKLGRKTGAIILRYLVCPIIGLLLTIWLWFSLSGLALMIGLLWLVVGLIISFTYKSAEAPV